MLLDYKNKYNRNNNSKAESLLSGSIGMKVVMLSLLVLTSLVFTQLIFANNLATDGDKLSQVQEDIKELEKQNMILKSQIAQASSLTNLSKIAKSDGFVKPQSNQSGKF